jgi:hypothetical protein
MTEGVPALDHVLIQERFERLILKDEPIKRQEHVNNVLKLRSEGDNFHKLGVFFC